MLRALNEAVSGVVWGPPMLVFFLGAGLYFTAKTRGLQFFRLKEILFSPFQSDRREGSISSFAAVSGALAGTLGIGNIVGVAGAILLGGPGSVFWMLASGFLCMILKYAETVLAMCWRTKNAKGETVGGPMYYLRDALKMPGMAAVFCLLCIAAALFGGGNVTQIGTVSIAVRDAFGIQAVAVSAACAVAIGLMTGGSVKRLGRVFAVLTPLMSVVFLAAAGWVIFRNAGQLPDVFRRILAGAFAPKAAAGGAGAYGLLAAARYGVSRGVFSNEAGMGSSPIIHAASENSPEKQGLCGAFEVFFDTVVVAGITALAILCSGAPLTAKTPFALASAAFSTAFGAGAEKILTVMLVIFAVSSVPCWYYYGERCVEFLFPGKKERPAKTAYRLSFFFLMVACPLFRLDGIWQLADSLNGLMAIPNLFAVLLLSRQVTDVTDRWAASSRRNRPRQISTENSSCRPEAS